MQHTVALTLKSPTVAFNLTNSKKICLINRLPQSLIAPLTFVLLGNPIAEQGRYVNGFRYSGTQCH